MDSVNLKDGSIEDNLRRNSSELSNENANIFLGTDLSELKSNNIELPESLDKTMIVNSLELKKRARQIQVSTEDSEVKAYLRTLGEPICYFGEDAADRRNRLKTTLALLGESAVRKVTGATTEVKVQEEDNTLWYHEGAESLRVARMWLLEHSIPCAKRRLETTRKFYNTVPEVQRKARVQEYYKEIKNIQLDCSQFGDDRPLSYCQFSPDGKHLATASWSGLCKIWSVPTSNLEKTLRGHTEKCGCVTWHPRATLESGVPIALASSGHNGSVHFWSLDSEEPLADIEGHSPYRVSRVKFHPSGRFMATACFDSSWRLWDLHKCEEILHQEGHSAEVFDIAFHTDGSLLLSGGFDSYARVWDLRTGRCIMFLEGHSRPVLTVNFANNGFHMLTAGEDNTCRIWDLRQQTCIYNLPAHTSNVTCAKFQNNDTNFILTASYDTTVKLWGHPIWTPLKTLQGHSGKIMYADIRHDNAYIATCSYDHTFKLWDVNASKTSDPRGV